MKAGCEDEVVVSGLLHDTLEDTDTKEEEILELFGQRVLEIVKGCSESDKGASWEERKQHTLDELKYAPLPIRLVVCADKLHNLRSIKRDLATTGETAWEKFKRGRGSQKMVLHRHRTKPRVQRKFSIIRTFAIRNTGVV
ncbi:(p)ppGpp synthase/HD superfamily hydrolase [Paenibacillus sp. V4I9]|uniref:HD domain-containing protein n=1 Tax=Paenibacillus sp. V4I9 TaxID=3042308 RepID=UPI002787E9E3|nr:HD domain-containing protein [Paenibacillus sp. V4I9]MDQ0885034.1 (p)ppGpp synthase/HD superfamily hydrolase [Paenibacillus sp. V4I9]